MIGLQKIKRRFSVAFQKKMSAPHLKSLEEEEDPYALCCNGAALPDINNNNDGHDNGLNLTLGAGNGSERSCKCKYQTQKGRENGPALDVVKDFDHISVNDDSGCPSCSSPTRKSLTNSAHYLNGHVNGVSDSPVQTNGHHPHSTSFGPPHFLSRSSIISNPCGGATGGGDLVRTLSDRVDPCGTSKSNHKEELKGTKPKAASKKSLLHYHQRFRKNGMTASVPSGPLQNGAARHDNHDPHHPSSNGTNSTTTRSLTAQCRRHHIKFFSSYGFSKQQGSGAVNGNSLSASYSANGGGSRLGLEPVTPSSTTSAGALKALSQEEISKRLSLPADIHIPDSFLTRNFSQPILNGPLSRKDRRDSLYEIGFGRSDTYTKLDKVGEGTYATVYRGRSRLTDNFVALKEIRLEYEEGAPCTAIREVSLLKNLKHANIVTLHDIVHTTKSLTLVFEYLERDLKQYMEDCDNIMNINNVKLFLFQLFRGLEFCHRKQILHRDLKPQNLLINKIGELKLADFGLARAKSVPTKTFSNEVVTLWYRPPEVLLGSTEYSTPIDMWGVGCIFYEMANGKPLFPGSTVEDQLQIIFKTMGTPAENQWPGISLNEDFKTYCPKPPKAPHSPLHVMSPRLDKDGINFLGRLLMYDPKKRISAKEGLRHPYFKSFPEKIHHLPDTTSIFVLPGIKLSKDPGSKLSSSNTGKFRRQSLL